MIPDLVKSICKRIDEEAKETRKDYLFSRRR